jgi:hypothetical protein
MLRRRQLGLAVIALNLADLAIMVVLALQRGWLVVVFAVTGLVLSIAYTSPPLRLKKRGLGELDVLVTWGPLMVAGTYFSAVGELPWQVWVASVPYGLLCTSVLMGKHIDKIPYDEPTGTRTLPGRARRREGPRRDHRPARGLLRLDRSRGRGRRAAVAGAARRARPADAAHRLAGAAGPQARRAAARLPGVAAVFAAIISSTSPGRWTAGAGLVLAAVFDVGLRWAVRSGK